MTKACSQRSDHAYKYACHSRLEKAKLVGAVLRPANATHQQMIIQETPAAGEGSMSRTLSDGRIQLNHCTLHKTPLPLCLFILSQVHGLLFSFNASISILDRSKLLSVINYMDSKYLFSQLSPRNAAAK